MFVLFISFWPKKVSIVFLELSPAWVAVLSVQAWVYPMEESIGCFEFYSLN